MALRTDCRFRHLVPRRLPDLLDAGGRCASQTMDDASYRPSGNIHFPTFLPLVTMALVGAWALGTVQSGVRTVDMGHYAMAGVLGMPVVLAVCAMVRWGRCRAPRVAMWAALAVGLAYAGTAGQSVCGALREGGLSWGQTVYALELLACVALGMALARRIASGVFFEESRTWARRQRLFFSPVDEAELIAVVQAEDWSRVRALRSRVRTSLSLVIEHPPTTLDAPIFVSVQRTGLGGCFSMCSGPVRRKRVEAASAAVLAEALDVSLGSLRVVEAGTKRAPVVSPASVGAWTDLGDFRAEAIAASVRHLADSDGDAEVVSLCWPVGDVVPCAGRLPFAGGAVGAAWCLVALVALAAGGAIGLTSLPGWLGVVLALAVGTVVFVVGALGVWLTPYWSSRKWRRRFLRRRETLLRADTWDAGWDLNICAPRDAGAVTMAPVDFGFCEFDWANQRLLIEGLRCRYVIRAEDIVSLASASERGRLSVVLTCNVAGGVPLRLVLVRRAECAWLPFFQSLYPRRDQDWWLRQFTRTLSVARD